MKLTFRLPPSFPALLLAGFVLVALPLLGGILGMSYALEQMAREGRQSVNVTADITLASRQLAEAGTALKRAAGQYFVLEDPALKQRLARGHQRFREILATLQGMPWDAEQRRLLDGLSTREVLLFNRLGVAPVTGAAAFEGFRDEFDRLERDAAAVADEAARVVQRQVAGMRETADRIEATLVWQVGAMILLSLLLSGLLSWLLSRPVFQLAAAIRRLGRNDLKTLSPIRGPRDMVYLGEQLDWLRRRLLELEAQKLRFFREVSHELKTPLTNLLEAVALLRDEVAGRLTEQQREIVAIMRSSSRDLKQRIEDLLRYNEALSQPRGEPTLFELPALVAEVAARFDLPRRKKGLRLVTKVPAMRLRLDRGRLAVALENLLSNAVKFSPPAGEIGVGAVPGERGLLIRVQDQGPGVPPDETAKLFQPFHKGTRQPQGALKSSGLGLAIAKAHVEALGGQLSLRPGPGTCFQILLPIAQENEFGG